MELKDTIALMTSDDYRDRFKAEYWQTKIRAGKLHSILQNWETWSQDKELKTQQVILERQLHAMLDYLSECALRADIEGINLEV